MVDSSKELKSTLFILINVTEVLFILVNCRYIIQNPDPLEVIPTPGDLRGDQGRVIYSAK